MPDGAHDRPYFYKNATYMKKIRLVVFDMAGTTIRDNHEVESCIFEAALLTGLDISPNRVHDMNGLPKRLVFETLWKDVIGASHPDYPGKVEKSYEAFREILERHYRTEPVHPTEGAVETLGWLRSIGIKIAFNTGFYREVADIILRRLGWDKGLDEKYSGGDLIDLSVTPSETGGKGRPHPDMILYAMDMLGISDPKEVVKIGDAPVDILEGKAAGCRLSLGLTNGCHRREELEAVLPDGLLGSLHELKAFLEGRKLV